MAHNHKKRRRASFKKKNDTPTPFPVIAVIGFVVGMLLLRIKRSPGLRYLLVPPPFRWLFEYFERRRMYAEMRRMERETYIHNRQHKVSPGAFAQTT